MAGNGNGSSPSRAQVALANSPFYELRHLRVDQRERTLLLSGTVSSFYHKQLAQEVVRAVSDGCEVVNDVHVK
ncbi:MAG: BON domain-containing protein [Planctomycetota bacterium]